MFTADHFQAMDGSAALGTLTGEENLGLSVEQSIAVILLQGLSATQTGICLCDEKDDIRLVNDAFRLAVFPDLTSIPVNFVDALADGIRSGRGIKLDSMPIEAFVPKVKERRRTGPDRSDFSADLADGGWLRVSDHRLSSGWTVSVAMNISSIKHEELALKHAHASALKASQTDWLTGIANRACGMEHAGELLSKACCDHKPLTLALFDLDHFKLINDVHGHEVGDRVLVHFAQSISEKLDKQDQLSRIGGEEFLLVMPNSPPKTAEFKIQKLLRELPPLNRKSENKPSLSISFSAGLAWSQPSEPLNDLIGRADVALYLAKANGRGRLEIGAAVEKAAGGVPTRLSSNFGADQFDFGQEALVAWK